jgi:two-component system sensor histidine kinase CpxA
MIQSFFKHKFFRHRFFKHRFFKHRLFWKIILIFWLTTIATIVANILITREIVQNEFKVEQVREKMRILAPEAVYIYEQEGTKELKLWYRKLKKREGIRVVLLNERNQPIVPNLRKKFFRDDDDDDDHEHDHDDDDHRPLKEHILNLADQQISSPSGRSYVLRILPSRYLESRFNPDFLHGYRLLASFIIILIGSLWIARSIAKPIRILQQASLQISQGKLDIRVSQDIGKRNDELGELACAFDQMADKVSELISSQQQLFRDISHEIRTPLTRQKLAIELARSSEDASILLDKIEHQNQCIEDMINQLLTLMQTNNDQLKLTERVNLSSLFERIINDSELELEGKKLNVDKELLSDSTVIGDSSLLTRALENLFTNAIKYSPEGSNLSVKVHDENNNIGIVLSDEGPGIPEDELDSILKPFYRADKSRNRGTGGFGLGLAISSQIIKKHNGEITLSNCEPNGLKVEVLLPKA